MTSDAWSCAYRWLAVCVMVKVADHLGSSTHKVLMLVNRMTNLAFFSSFSESCKRHRCPPPQSWKKQNIKFRLCKQVWYSSCLSSWCREDWHGGSLVDLQVSPGPSVICCPAMGSLEEEGGPGSRMPHRAPVSPPWLLLVTHPELIMSRWEDLNYIFTLSTSHSLFLLLFQQTHLNHPTVKDWNFIWNNIRKRKTYFYP